MTWWLTCRMRRIRFGKLYRYSSEQRIAYGIILCRIYTQKNVWRGASLKQNGFRATMTHGKGSTNEVDIIETVIDRNQMKALEDTLTGFDANIFYVIEDVRTKQNGIFAKRKNILTRWRVGK